MKSKEEYYSKTELDKVMDQYLDELLEKGVTPEEYNASMYLVRKIRGRFS